MRINLFKQFCKVSEKVYKTPSAFIKYFKTLQRGLTKLDLKLVVQRFCFSLGSIKMQQFSVFSVWCFEKSLKIVTAFVKNFNLVQKTKKINSLTLPIELKYSFSDRKNIPLFLDFKNEVVRNTLPPLVCLFVCPEFCNLWNQITFKNYLIFCRKSGCYLT